MYLFNNWDQIVYDVKGSQMVLWQRCKYKTKLQFECKFMQNKNIIFSQAVQLIYFIGLFTIKYTFMTHGTDYNLLTSWKIKFLN